MKGAGVLYRSRIPGELLLFLALTALGLLVFRDGLIAVARHDHFYFMRERLYYATDREFLGAVLSYNRIRHILPGDTFLFRPGTHLLLGFLDLFFREHLLMRGLFSLLLHGMTVYFLLRLLRLVLPVFPALLLVLPFAVPYAGMEMVFWRHVSPYMLMLIFFGLGSEALVREKSWRPASLYFGAGMFFHELLPMVLICSALTIFLLFRKREERKLYRDRLRAFLIPAVVWLFLNMVDLVFRFPGRWLGNEDGGGRSFSLLFGFREYLTANGLMVTSFALPHWVQLVFEDPAFRAVWDYSPLTAFWLIPAGLVLAVLMVLAAVKFFRHSCPALVREEGMPFWMAGWFLLLMPLSLTLFRALPRGESTLSYATYYFYISSFMLTLVAGWLLSRVWRRVKGRSFLLLAGFLCLWSFGTAWSQGRQLQDLLVRRVDGDRRIEAAVNRLSQFFSAHPDLCYGGTSLDDFGRQSLDAYLMRRACGDDGRAPVYLVRDPGGAAVLSRFLPAKLDARELPLQRGELLELSYADEKKEDIYFPNQPDSEHPVRVLWSFPEAYTGALFFGGGDAESYLLIRKKDDSITLRFRLKGEMFPPVQKADLPGLEGEGTVLLEGTLEGYLIFWNRYLLFEVKTAQPLSGRAGAAPFAGQVPRIFIPASPAETLSRWEPFPSPDAVIEPAK